MTTSIITGASHRCDEGMNLSSEDVVFLNRAASRKFLVAGIVALSVFAIFSAAISILYFKKANRFAEVAELHPSHVLWDGLKQIDQSGFYSGNYVIATNLFNRAIHHGILAVFILSMLGVLLFVRLRQRRRFARILEFLRANNLVELIDGETGKPPDVGRKP